MENIMDSPNLEIENEVKSNEKEIHVDNLNFLNLEIKQESQESNEQKESNESQESQVPKDQPSNILIENPIDEEVQVDGNLIDLKLQDTETQEKQDQPNEKEKELNNNKINIVDKRDNSNRLTLATEKSIDSSRKIIVVFGSGGSGKTSLINALCNVNEQLNDGAGCNVMEAKSYDFKNGFDEYTFFDTMGLNTVDTNGDEEKTASFKLSKLLKEKNREISLFIFVFKGIINKEQKKDYDNFYAKKNSKIPILCVVNGLESERNKQEWVEKNKHYFERNNLIFNEIVGSSFIKHEFEDHDVNYKKMRVESGNNVWDSINRILINFDNGPSTSTTATTTTTPIKKKSTCTIL